jgi:nucleotide-binding universal stress UspA family protein
MTGRILVGADGSLRSVAALRWAVAHAATARGSVDVVTTWEQGVGAASLPLSMGAVAGQGASVGILRAEEMREVLAAEARALARRCVRQAGADASPLTVRTWAMMGSPGTVLCDLAGPADLLVVGHSGHGAQVGGLVGSVAAHLIDHSPCPVVVVRDART